MAQWPVPARRVHHGDLLELVDLALEIVTTYREIATSHCEVATPVGVAGLRVARGELKMLTELLPLAAKAVADLLQWLLHQLSSCNSFRSSEPTAIMSMHSLARRAC